MIPYSFTISRKTFMQRSVSRICLVSIYLNVYLKNITLNIYNFNAEILRESTGSYGLLTSLHHYAISGKICNHNCLAIQLAKWPFSSELQLWFKVKVYKLVATLYITNKCMN